MADATKPTEKTAPIPAPTGKTLPVPTSRSMAKRIAVMRGLPLPTFEDEGGAK